MDHAALTWRKSSHSQSQSNCVEVSPGAIRDSKDPTGPTLTIALIPLLTAIKCGQLER